MNIYTVGYSQFELEELIKLLNSLEIDRLIDVRSYPYSRKSSYNKENLVERFNRELLIDYSHEPRLGGKPANKIFYPRGYPDYNLIKRSSTFKDAVEEILDNQELNICFMCQEPIPETCHRALLVGQTFHEKGYPVFHIRKNLSLIKHSDLLKKLIIRSGLPENEVILKQNKIIYQH